MIKEPPGGRGPARWNVVVTVRVFVTDAESPTGLSRTACDRVKAAVARAGERAELRVLPLAGDEALDFGAHADPTVVVGDLVLFSGTAPSAGRVLRAIDAVGGSA